MPSERTQKPFEREAGIAKTGENRRLGRSVRRQIQGLYGTSYIIYVIGHYAARNQCPLQLHFYDPFLGFRAAFGCTVLE